MVDGDLSALIISGRPTDGELAEAWANIYIEYLEINKDNESLYIINLERDIVLLKDELDRVEEALKFITSPFISHIEPEVQAKLLKILSDYGYKVDLSLSGDKLAKQMKALDNKRSSKRLELRRKISEYNQYMEDKKDFSIDRSYFNRMLNRMGKHYNCFIEESKITVARFVDMIQQYFQELQAKQQRMEDVKHG